MEKTIEKLVEIGYSATNMNRKNVTLLTYINNEICFVITLKENKQFSVNGIRLADNYNPIISEETKKVVRSDVSMLKDLGWTMIDD